MLVAISTASAPAKGAGEANDSPTSRASGLFGDPLPFVLEEHRSSGIAATKVLYVVWDGVRWQDVASSLQDLPVLRSLATRGAAWIADPPSLAVSGPNFISMPGYAELLTGTASHGCRDNACVRLRVPTIVHQVIDAKQSAAAFTSWEPLGRYFAELEGTAFVGSFGRASKIGAEEGFARGGMDQALAAAAAEPPLGEATYRPDAATAEVVRAYLFGALPELLFVSLGDTDEHAHAGNYLGYLKSLRFADRALGEWLEAYTRRNEDVLVVVTTDHGRANNFRDHGAKYPESQFTWAVAAHSRHAVITDGQVTTASQLSASIRSAMHLGPKDETSFTLSRR